MQRARGSDAGKAPGVERDASPKPSSGNQKANGRAADVAVRRMANKDRHGPVRVLITGYGAFDGIENNPSGEIAKDLAKFKIPGAIIKTEVLPVTWKDVDAYVAKELPAFKPDIVVSMGYSAGHHEIKEFAVNKREGADATNVEGGGKKITSKGPEFEKTTLPVDRILNDQKKLGEGGLEGVDHTEPDDDYLCNYVEYKELKALQNTGAEVGFLHISDVDRDLPAIEQLLQSTVADMKEKLSHEGESVKESGGGRATPADAGEAK